MAEAGFPASAVAPSCQPAEGPGPGGPELLQSHPGRFSRVEALGSYFFGGVKGTNLNL